MPRRGPTPLVVRTRRAPKPHHSVSWSSWLDAEQCLSKKVALTLQNRNNAGRHKSLVVGCWRRGRKTPSGEKKARSLRPRSNNTTPYVRVPSTSTLHCPICLQDHNASLVLTSRGRDDVESSLSTQICQHRTTCTQTYLTPPVPTLS